MLSERILTIEEVCEHLRVPVDVINHEIEDGRLKAKKVGADVRIRESWLNEYMDGASAIPVLKAPSEQFRFKPAPNFDHIWPTAKGAEKKVEKFTEAREGTASYGGKEHHVKVGFTWRKSAGRRRYRSLVLVDRYATVEFVAADDRTNGKMASTIRDRDKKQLPPGATPPTEYQGLPVGPYRDVVSGPGAPNGLAVICDAQDIDTMVKHALIRYQYRLDRK